MLRIANRYGRALFNLTKDDMPKAKKQLAALKVVKSLFDGTTAPDASKVLVNPVMPPDLKRSLLDYALDKAGADLDLKHLMAEIVVAGRVPFIPQVVDSFATLIDEAEGVARADITSAVALNPEELNDIGQTLGTLLKKKVAVTSAVDAGLLGGFVARVGNYRVDMSLKSKLDGLSESAVHDTN